VNFAVLLIHVFKNTDLQTRSLKLIPYFRFVKNTHYVLHRETDARRWEP